MVIFRKETNKIISGNPVLGANPRNEALDVLKLFFTVVVIAHHSGYISGLLNRGYIAVEFFFIVSGMLLFGTFEKYPELSTAGFFVKRAKQLYPEYWFSLVVLLLSQIMMGKQAYTHWYSPILEITLTRCIGIPMKTEAINGPCWYLSVLIFGGLLLYYLLRKLPRNIFNATAIGAIAVIYGLLASRSVSIEQWDTISSIIYLPFWRGIADMLIGIIICQLPKPHRLMGNILEVISGIGVLALLHLNGNYDYLASVVIALLIWAIRSGRSIIRVLGRNQIVTWFSKLQYGLYVNHICVVTIFRQIHFLQSTNHWIRLLFLLACIFILAIIGKCILYLLHKVLMRTT